MWCTWRGSFFRALEQCHEAARDIAELGFWIGWRLGELLALEWRFVDAEHGTIRLPRYRTKGGEGRVIYLPPRAAEILSSWHERRIFNQTITDNRPLPRNSRITKNRS
jgi:integrase